MTKWVHVAILASLAPVLGACVSTPNHSGNGSASVGPLQEQSAKTIVITGVSNQIDFAVPLTVSEFENTIRSIGPDYEVKFHGASAEAILAVLSATQISPTDELRGAVRYRIDILAGDGDVIYATDRGEMVRRGEFMVPAEPGWLCQVWTILAEDVYPTDPPICGVVTR